MAYYNRLKKEWLNATIATIKEDLRFRSTTTALEEIDFYQILLDKVKVDKFIEIVQHLHKEKEIDSKDIRGFKLSLGRTLYWCKSIKS